MTLLAAATASVTRVFGILLYQTDGAFQMLILLVEQA